MAYIYKLKTFTSGVYDPTELSNGIFDARKSLEYISRVLKFKQRINSSIEGERMIGEDENYSLKIELHFNPLNNGNHGRAQMNYSIQSKDLKRRTLNRRDELVNFLANIKGFFS